MKIGKILVNLQNHAYGYEIYDICIMLLNHIAGVYMPGEDSKEENFNSRVNSLMSDLENRIIELHNSKKRKVGE